MDSKKNDLTGKIIIQYSTFKAFVRYNSMIRTYIPARSYIYTYLMPIIVCANPFCNSV